MEENPKDFVRVRIRTSDGVSEVRHSSEEVWRRGRRWLRGRRGSEIKLAFPSLPSLPSPLSLPPGSDEHFEGGFLVPPRAAARLAARTLAIVLVFRRLLAVLTHDQLGQVESLLRQGLT